MVIYEKLKKIWSVHFVFISAGPKHSPFRSFALLQWAGVESEAIEDFARAIFDSGFHLKY